MASLTGPGVFFCVVMLRAGAITLSFGGEQKKERIARQAVCGPWTQACLAALVAPLTLASGDICIIPFPALEQAFIFQLEPTRSAGAALHTVSPVTGLTRDVAGCTQVAVPGVVALWAVFHTGCVEKKVVPPAGATLVLCGSHAVEALFVTGLAPVSLLVPVLDGGTFLVSHTGPTAVHPQAFPAACADAKRRAGMAGFVAISAILSLFFIVSS